MKKIALEEHFWTEGFPRTGRVGADLFEPWFLHLIDQRLGEFSELRIAAMDAAGIDVSVLSLISPGVQIERDVSKAVSASQRVNDVLAGVEARMKASYLSGWIATLDRILHRVDRLDDIVAMWKVRAAREAAWTNAETLWAIRGDAKVRADFVRTLQRTVGLAGRGLLVPADTWLRRLARRLAA